MTILQLSDSSAWALSYPTHQTFAEQITANIYRQIPEIFIPVLFNSRYLAFLFESDTAHPERRFAGWLNHRIVLGLTLSGQSEADVNQVRKTYLNRITLLTFESLASTIAISYTPAYKLRDIKITIWEYIRPIPDDIDDQLIRMEAMLASLTDV